MQFCTADSLPTQLFILDIVSIFAPTFRIDVTLDQNIAS